MIRKVDFMNKKRLILVIIEVLFICIGVFFDNYALKNATIIIIALIEIISLIFVKKSALSTYFVYIIDSIVIITLSYLVLFVNNTIVAGRFTAEKWIFWTIILLYSIIGCIIKKKK